MPFRNTGSLLVLVDPQGDDAEAALGFSQNAKFRHLGRAEDALTHENNDDDSQVDLRAGIINPDAFVNVHLALSFDRSPKDVSKGFVFGSNQETCDVLLAMDNHSGISGNHFSISVDWLTGNPLITCLTPSDDSKGIRIMSGDSWILYFGRGWKVLDPGTTTAIEISEEMQFVVHSPGRENREPAYSDNLQKYLRKCQDAVPTMSSLKLYDPEPTPLLVSRGRGLTGMEYFTTSTVVGENTVICEAKSHHNWLLDSESSIFIVKRFRKVHFMWKNHATSRLEELRELRHRHITPLEDVISERTEYMPVYFPEPSETLADRHLKGPLLESDVGQILAQVFEGLKFLHANGIVHGSLYPGSIQIKHSGPWSIRLSDIALSPYVELEDSRERQLYASQRKNGIPIPVPEWDTWSAGVVGLNLLDRGGLPSRPAYSCKAQKTWTATLAARATGFYIDENSRPRGRKNAALFLTHVLKHALHERPTAEECLQHPWIQHWRLPINYDREDSQDPNDPHYYWRPAHDEADDDGSGEDTETEAPRTSKSKGKQPQRLSVASEDEGGSGEDTETETPRSSKSKSKQPQRRPSITVASYSNPHRQRASRRRSLPYPGRPPTASQRSPVVPSPTWQLSNEALFDRFQARTPR